MALFSEITFERITAEIQLYLKKTYNKADILFSPASVYGQVLKVLTELFQLSLVYQKNAISLYDLSDANSLNKKIITSAARFAGHNPTRAISASGNLRFQLRSSTDIEKDIAGSKITIFDKTAIRNKTNNLEYIIDLGVEKQTYQLTNGTQFFVNIIQGRYESITLTGTGEPNQTFSVEIPTTKEIENFNVTVEVNGEQWSVKKHIYDMLPDEKACVVMTGFNGGIDIIFGNSGFGYIPPLASSITVKYILTDGSNGNIFRRTINDWKFIEEVIDGFGNTIDITQYFDIFIYNDINFGADGESIQFTKNVLPIVSSNFVLGLPQQYAYQIKKLGVFSHVNAYELDGIVYIVATPNINLFKNKNKDYFEVSIDAFTLDNYEKSKIDKYLKISGNIQLTKKYTITSPVLSYYIMNIYYIGYTDSVDENVNNQIIEKISTYFLNITRTDRIPKVDLIKELAKITDIDSVDISFVCKKNEDYHNEYNIKNTNRRNQYANTIDMTEQKKFSAYDPNASYGIDPILGDIIFEPNEIPIIRGGWKDRYGVFYEASSTTKSFSSVNIFKKGTTDRKTINSL